MSTAYVVLDRTSDGRWNAHGVQISARSAKAAIQSYLEAADDREGEYVAVPARSWRPVTVKVETKTALKFS